MNCMATSVFAVENAACSGGKLKLDFNSRPEGSWIVTNKKATSLCCGNSTPLGCRSYAVNEKQSKNGWTA